MENTRQVAKVIRVIELAGSGAERAPNKRVQLDAGVHDHEGARVILLLQAGPREVEERDRLEDGAHLRNIFNMDLFCFFFGSESF